MSHARMHLALALALSFLGGRAHGQAAASTTAPVEPQADAVLRQMSEFLGGLGQFSFEVNDTIDELTEGGQKLQFASTRRISVRRPNKISAEIVGDLIDERVRYDGSTLTVLDIRQNVYGAIKVPDNIDEMLDFVAERFGLTMPLADLLFSDPFEAVIGGVRLGQYVGLHGVFGVKCHHLAFRQDGLDWQIWIEDGEKPFPRKLVITYKSMPGQPQYAATLGAWNVSPQLPESAFTLEIPPGVKRLDLEKIATQEPMVETPVEEPGASEPGDR